MGKEVDCSKCKYIIPVHFNNLEALSIINLIGTGLVSGMGIVNYHGIETAFRILEIPKYKQRDLFEKMNVYIEEALNKLGED